MLQPTDKLELELDRGTENGIEIVSSINIKSLGIKKMIIKLSQKKNKETYCNIFIFKEKTVLVETNEKIWEIAFNKKPLV